MNLFSKGKDFFTVILLISLFCATNIPDEIKFKVSVYSNIIFMCVLLLRNKLLD